MPELTAIQLDELRHKLRVERAVAREMEWLNDRRPVVGRKIRKCTRTLSKPKDESESSSVSETNSTLSANESKLIKEKFFP